MRETVRVLAVLGLTLGFVVGLNSSQVSAVELKRQVLDGGGAMWLETASLKLCSSAGQSIIGIQKGPTMDNYTGFWNPWVVQRTPVEWEEMQEAQLPAEFGLSQNFPNPFNPATVIEYALPRGSEVSIRIYNILGQKVRSLLDEQQKAGYKMIRWDGKDDNGMEVSSGVYLYRIVAHTVDGSGDFVESKKMILLK